MIKIDGYCPMGCGQTLFVSVVDVAAVIALGQFGREADIDSRRTPPGVVTCSYVDCPRPTAVDELLSDTETEHVVVFTDHGFTVRHPLRERLDDRLLLCHLHAWIADAGHPPAKPGTYRVRSATLSESAGRWTFEEVGT